MRSLEPMRGIASWVVLSRNTYCLEDRLHLVFFFDSAPADVGGRTHSSVIHITRESRSRDDARQRKSSLGTFVLPATVALSFQALCFACMHASAAATLSEGENSKQAYSKSRSIDAVCARTLPSLYQGLF